MAKITDFKFKDKKVYEKFNKKLESSSLSKNKKEELKYIFKVCMENKELFVKVKGKISDENDYIEKWINKYISAVNNDIFKRVGKASKTLPDPVIDIIIKEKICIDRNELNKLNDGHRLYMSAEQIQGLILEAFIAKKLKPYGWYYCYGEIVRGVDFCHKSGKLLQIKNKYNTENSSSVTIREGTTIKKWHRLSKPCKGKIVYNWNELCNIVNENNDDSEDSIDINEGDYNKFVKEVMRKNPSLLYIDNDNIFNTKDE